MIISGQVTVFECMSMSAAVVRTCEYLFVRDAQSGEWHEGQYVRQVLVESLGLSVAERSKVAHCRTFRCIY